MDEDFEDLLRDSGDLDAEYSSPEKPSSSKLPDINARLNIDEKAIPSANEVRLGKRVMDLEKERDVLMAEITLLKAQEPPPPNPTVPVLAPISTPNPTSQSNSSNEPVVIPPSLIPVLSILRTHISELTKDNQALRYTFLGPNPPSRGTIKPSQNPIVPSPLPIPTATAPPMSTGASSSKVTLDVDMIPSPSLGVGTGAGTQNPPSPSVVASGKEDTEKSVGLSQIDLEKVLDRVKELVRENEELGEMILESGRKEGLEKVLEDSRNVISSLDSDLTHHLSLVESLRTELSTYKSHFGPIPIPSSTLNVPSKHSISSNASTPTRPSHRDRDREREQREGSSHSHSHSRRDDKRNGEGGARRYDAHPSNRGGVPSNRDRERSNGNGNGSGRGIPSGPSGNRNGLKEDDRAYKRRR
ncbi:hypothetical protein I302_108935 [Kwoniella bestiolae CBS 10118]|uniref:Uncharacterized protein n=1 Tax=Kwoniella bestiolae CBS 10118 TaxID=1296100 RepID=A0A1B9FUI1_9TREE|nr:hypothetical protein I302_08076 [Kwoniella bestiolae CBS 10118]OCF22428.1 hypothetical protein I302_08076 [Kwoniella bestiolae CBS 10118]